MALGADRSLDDYLHSLEGILVESKSVGDVDLSPLQVAKALKGVVESVSSHSRIYHRNNPIWC